MYSWCRGADLPWAQVSHAPPPGAFIALLCHFTQQDEPIGGNPPTYGDLFRGKARDGPMGHLGRPPEPKQSGNDTPQVSSVVQVPGKAKAKSDECPSLTQTHG